MSFCRQTDVKESNDLFSDTIRKSHLKPRPLSELRGNGNLPLQAVYNRMTDAQSQPCTLREIISFVEPFEYMFLILFRNTATSIFHIRVV